MEVGAGQHVEMAAAGHQGKMFQLLVTFVSKVNGLIKLFGQTDVKTGQTVNKYLSCLRDQLESGQHATHISPGQSVVAKHDGVWYRGKVNTVSGIKVAVHLVDTGQTQVCHLANIRTEIPGELASIPPLASEYVLGEVVPPAADWSKPSIEFVRDALQGDVCTAQVLHRSHGYTFVRVFKAESREPLAHDMIQCGFAVAGYPNLDTMPPADNYSPPQMAAVMPIVHHKLSSPSSGGQIGPPSPNFAPLHDSSLSPEDLNYQTSAWSDGVNGSSVQQNDAGRSRYSGPPANKQYPPSSRLTKINSAIGMRPLALETGTWYPVTISSVELGPPYFFIQLNNLSEKLDELMRTINSVKLNHLPRGQVEEGTPCLARYSVDKSIYRAVIISKGEHVKVQYLDYGNSESLSRDQIFEIPENFLAPHMLAVPCRLYQWPDNISGGQMDAARNKFDSFSTKNLNCRVMSLEEGGGVFGHLNIVQMYEDSVDLGQELRMWVSRQPPASASAGGRNGGPPKKQWNKTDQVSSGLVMPAARGTISYSQVELVGTVDVFLSYHGKGPGLFYVQRADTTNQIQQIMREVANLVNTSPIPLPEPLPPRPGTPCLAQFNDGVWYRARVESPSGAGHNLKPGQIRVEFVDFGNCSNVWINQVYGIPASLVTCLPAQAVPCRLSGNFANIQTEALVKPFLDIVQDNMFRIKVEKVLNKLCVVQASTTVHPVLNINSELSRLVSHLALSPVMGDAPMVLLVTHFESTNSFYGQRSTNGAEFAIFLANLAEYYSRCGVGLYGNTNESHLGEVCGIVDRSNPNFKFYRCKILGEQKSSAEIRILDVGGTKRVDKSCLMILPEEFQSPPEFGFQCSLGLNTPLTDNILRQNFQDCFVEVQKVREAGDLVIVKITQNHSNSVKNNHILRHLKEMSPLKPQNFDSYSAHKNTRINNSYHQGRGGFMGGGHGPPPPGHPPGQHQHHDPPPRGRGGHHQADLHHRGQQQHQEQLRGGHFGDQSRGSGGPYNNKFSSHNHHYQNRPTDSRGTNNPVLMDVNRNNNEFSSDTTTETSVGGGRTRRGGEEKRFERGDLRNSLRERRAAREVTLSKPVTTSYTFPKLHAGMRLQGKISWMFDPTNFYLQLERDAKAFNELMEAMQAEFRSGPFDPRHWNKGTPVAAKYSFDDCWYRGKVIGQRDKLVDVYFVDFGNTDKVDDINVLALPEEFGRLEVQAINCGLTGIDDLTDNWDKHKSCFARHFSDPIFKVEVVKAGKHCLVDLNGGAVASSLSKDTRITGTSTSASVMASHRNLGEERLKKNRKKEKDIPVAESEKDDKDKTTTSAVKMPKQQHTGFPELNLKSLLQTVKIVAVTHYVSWKEFWIQPDQEKLAELEDLLKVDKNLGEKFEDVKPGDKCLASQDGAWFRGQVNQVSEDKVTVFLVDVGRTVILPVGDIRTGSKLVLDRPVMAAKCKLDTKMAHLDKILAKSEHKLRLRFKSVHRSQLVVRMEKEKVDQQQGSAAAVREKKPEELGVSVTYLESVSRIWYVPGDKLEMLNQLMEDLSACKESLKSAEQIEMDKIYAVMYSEDGEMYRAKVVAKDQGEEADCVEVHFIDYGNNEVVKETEVLALPDKFDHHNAFAEVVNLKGADYAIDMPDIKDKLEDFLSNSHVTVKLTGGKSEGREGSLFVEGKPLNVFQWLRYKEPSFNLFRFCGSVRINCFITNLIEARGNVWIIEKNMLQDLERMMGDLQKIGGNLRTPKKLEKGRMLAARYSQDQELYRAKILNVRDKKAEVLYLDFGNSEALPVNQLMDLPKEFILHPGFAMKVTLDNKGEFREVQAEEIHQLISEGVQLTAELVQPKLNIVRLYLGGERIGYLPPSGGKGGRQGDEKKGKEVLPPTRFRTGDTEVVLTSGKHGQDSLAVQNIPYLKKLRQRLRNCDLDPALVEAISVKHVYLLQPHHQQLEQQQLPAAVDRDAAVHRVQVMSLQQDQVVLQLLDSKTSIQLPMKQLTNSLFKCPSSLLRMPPAAAKLSAMDAKKYGLDYYMDSRILLQSVVDKLVNLRKVKLEINCDSTNILASIYPSLKEMKFSVPKSLEFLTGNELCQLRNKIVQYSVSNDEKDKLELDELTTGFESTEERIQEFPIEEQDEVIENFETHFPDIDAETRSLSYHKDLAKLELPEVAKFTLVARSVSGTCLVNTSGHEARQKLDEQLGSLSGQLDKLSSDDSNVLAMFGESDGDERSLLQRCLVLDSCSDTARIFLLDSGRIRYCERDELYVLPAQLYQIPPLVFPVARIEGAVKVVGKVEMTARMMVDKDCVDMHVLEDIL